MNILSLHKLFPVLLASAAGIAPECARAEDARPNIVVLFADDLGYADLGCQGSQEVKTPRIDSLAAEGVRCTDAYVTAPMCSPSRAGILTGRYQQRFGYEFNLGVTHTMSKGLDPAEKTIADRLKAAGYTTGVIGKWDVGASAPYHPLERGFDEFYGFLGGSRQHKPATADMGPFNTMWRNREKVEETEWSSDIYSIEASDFITRHKDKPFFLYVSYTAPHWPMEVKDEDIAPFAHIQDKHRRALLGLMAGLDRGVGRVLDTLKEHKLDEKTLVIFLSDNGGATGPQRPSPDAPFQYGINASYNTPLRGVKGQLHDGGVRVPFIARWSGKLPAGRVSAAVISALDITATATALAGLPHDPALDGIPLVPILDGSQPAPERSLFWRVGGTSAIRHGAWKLVTQPDKPAELFHLAEDIGESRDLREQEPARFKALRDLLIQWSSEMSKPAWPAEAPMRNPSQPN